MTQTFKNITKNISDFYEQQIIRPAVLSGDVSIPINYSGGAIESICVSPKAVNKYSLETVTEVVLNREKNKGEYVNLTVDESIALYKQDPLFHTVW